MEYGAIQPTSLRSLKSKALPPPTLFPKFETPYSDITEQEAFGGAFRLQIFHLYVLLLPALLLATAAASLVLCTSCRVAPLLLCLACCIAALAAFLFALLGMFEPRDVLAQRALLHAVPLALLPVGGLACCLGDGTDVDAGATLLCLGVAVFATNRLALRVAHKVELERLEQWPPLLESDLV